MAAPFNESETIAVLKAVGWVAFAYVGFCAILAAGSLGTHFVTKLLS